MCMGAQKPHPEWRLWLLKLLFNIWFWRNFIGWDGHWCQNIDFPITFDFFLTSSTWAPQVQAPRGECPDLLGDPSRTPLPQVAYGGTTGGLRPQLRRDVKTKRSEGGKQRKRKRTLPRRQVFAFFDNFKFQITWHVIRHVRNNKAGSRAPWCWLYFSYVHEFRNDSFQKQHWGKLERKRVRIGKLIDFCLSNNRIS